MSKRVILVALAAAVALCLAGCKNAAEDSGSGGGDTPVPSDPYLTFKGNGAFNLGINTTSGKGWDGTVEYSTDKSNWTPWDGTIKIPAVEAGGSYYVYLRGKNAYFSSSTVTTILEITGAAGSVECSGNIMTLLDYENPGRAITNDYCFSYLFYGCTNLTKAPSLPATTLAISCYEQMFQGCKELTEAPALPATTLAAGCYACMFQNCTSLPASPALPATTLAIQCYYEMFYGCTALKSVGKIAATDIDEYEAMRDMFFNCSSLEVKDTTNPSEAFITINSIGGTNPVTNMFYNCKLQGSAAATPAAGSYKN